MLQRNCPYTKLLLRYQVHLFVIIQYPRALRNISISYITNLSVLGLWARTNDCGLFAWISLNALFWTYYFEI